MKRISPAEMLYMLNRDKYSITQIGYELYKITTLSDEGFFYCDVSACCLETFKDYLKLN